MASQSKSPFSPFFKGGFKGIESFEDKLKLILLVGRRWRLGNQSLAEGVGGGLDPILQV